MLIATGDWSKGDEAAPHRVIELLGTSPDVEVQEVPSLTPNLAADIAPADEVVFIDPEEALGEPWMEVAGGETPACRLVSRARELFRFRGKAYVCHVPGLDFSEGAPMTLYAESRARQAAALIQRFLAA